jgi:hypothetical protein
MTERSFRSLKTTLFRVVFCVWGPSSATSIPECACPDRHRDGRGGDPVQPTLGAFPESVVHNAKLGHVFDDPFIGRIHAGESSIAPNAALLPACTKGLLRRSIRAELSTKGIAYAMLLFFQLNYG